MRVVVSDSSCLIDLRKVSLLDALLRLPFEFLIPDTLFEDELLKFTVAQKKAMLRGGLKVIDLPGERVLRARAIIRQAPRLSVNDGFAFALAETNPGCILLTGDGELRDLATRHRMEVHGVLWRSMKCIATGLKQPGRCLRCSRRFPWTPRCDCLGAKCPHPSSVFPG
jgi:predicted nucleic acid-binding protein